MPRHDSEFSFMERTQVRRPKKYEVLMHNDDFTPMDFVTLVLMEVFHKDENHALELMLHIHNCEYAVVGVYVRDIALTLQARATEMAREEGYPLRVTVREEEELPF